MYTDQLDIFKMQNHYGENPISSVEECISLLNLNIEWIKNGKMPWVNYFRDYLILNLDEKIGDYKIYTAFSKDGKSIKFLITIGAVVVEEEVRQVLENLKKKFSLSPSFDSNISFAGQGRSFSVDIDFSRDIAERIRGFHYSFNAFQKLGEFLILKMGCKVVFSENQIYKKDGILHFSFEDKAFCKRFLEEVAERFPFLKNSISIEENVVSIRFFQKAIVERLSKSSFEDEFMLLLYNESFWPISDLVSSAIFGMSLKGIDPVREDYIKCLLFLLNKNDNFINQFLRMVKNWSDYFFEKKNASFVAQFLTNLSDAFFSKIWLLLRFAEIYSFSAKERAIKFLNAAIKSYKEYDLALPFIARRLHLDKNFKESFKDIKHKISKLKEKISYKNKILDKNFVKNYEGKAKKLEKSIDKLKKTTDKKDELLNEANHYCEQLEKDLIETDNIDFFDENIAPFLKNRFYLEGVKYKNKKKGEEVAKSGIGSQTTQVTVSFSEEIPVEKYYQKNNNDKIICLVGEPLEFERLLREKPVLVIKIYIELAKLGPEWKIEKNTEIALQAVIAEFNQPGGSITNKIVQQQIRDLLACEVLFDEKREDIIQVLLDNKILSQSGFFTRQISEDNRDFYRTISEFESRQVHLFTGELYKYNAHAKRFHPAEQPKFSGCISKMSVGVANNEVSFYFVDGARYSVVREFNSSYTGANYLAQNSTLFKQPPVLKMQSKEEGVPQKKLPEFKRK